MKYSKNYPSPEHAPEGNTYTQIMLRNVFPRQPKDNSSKSKETTALFTHGAFFRKQLANYTWEEGDPASFKFKKKRIKKLVSKNKPPAAQELPKVYSLPGVSLSPGYNLRRLPHRKGFLKQPSPLAQQKSIKGNLSYILNDQEIGEKIISLETKKLFTGTHKGKLPLTIGKQPFHCMKSP